MSEKCLASAVHSAGYDRRKRRFDEIGNLAFFLETMALRPWLPTAPRVAGGRYQHRQGAGDARSAPRKPARMIGRAVQRQLHLGFADRKRAVRAPGGFDRCPRRPARAGLTPVLARCFSTGDTKADARAGYGRERLRVACRKMREASCLLGRCSSVLGDREETSWRDQC